MMRHFLGVTVFATYCVFSADAVCQAVNINQYPLDNHPYFANVVGGKIDFQHEKAITNKIEITSAQCETFTESVLDSFVSLNDYLDDVAEKHQNITDAFNLMVDVSAGISVVKIVSGGPIKTAVATISLYVIHKLLEIGEEELPKFLIKQGYSADKVAKYSKAICGLLNKLCKLFVVIGGLKDICSKARGFTNNTMQAAKQSLKDFAKNFKYEKHHVFNKFRGNSKYSNYFKNLGIDVDKYCIRLTKAKHETLYWCTAKWKSFIDSHPIPANLTEAQKTILRDCVFKFAKTMVREAGLSWKDIIPYK
jgi:hypothetical protein